MTSKSKATILVVEDEPAQREPIVHFLRHQGYHVIEAENAECAERRVEEQSVDLVLTDLSLPAPSAGLGLIRWMAKKVPDVGILVLTGHTELSICIEAMQGGARDYLVKAPTYEVLLAAVQRVLSHVDGRRADAASVELVAESPAMREVLRQAQQYAEYGEPVLITGETGTGKEVIAQHIHARSNRREKSLVPINCYGLPDTLVEAELFGHTKSAFTGATDRRGYFETAKGSTLFLDEIGDATPSFQGKLLRVLQEGRITRLGESKDIQVDVRVIAATHRDLLDPLSKAPFRRDLFERLAVLNLVLPPLRDRVEDIPALVQHIARAFVQGNSKRHSKTPHFTTEAIRLLQEQPWTGNVRELQRTVKRAVVAAHDDAIGGKEIRAILGIKPDGHRSPAEGISSRVSLDDELRDFKLRRVEETLEETDGNKTEAAALLGISRKCLYDILATKK